VEAVAHQSRRAARKSRDTGLGVGFGTEPRVKDTVVRESTVGLAGTVAIEDIAALERTVALVRTIALVRTPSLLEQEVHGRRHRGD
jgi:hypothetical protein